MLTLDIAVNKMAELNLRMFNANQTKISASGLYQKMFFDFGHGDSFDITIAAVDGKVDFIDFINMVNEQNEKQYNLFSTEIQEGLALEEVLNLIEERFYFCLSQYYKDKAKAIHNS